jgi:hypothetical protein
MVVSTKATGLSIDSPVAFNANLFSSLHYECDVVVVFQRTDIL